MTEDQLSPATRGRELKLAVQDEPQIVFESPATRGRELKLLPFCP